MNVTKIINIFKYRSCVVYSSPTIEPNERINDSSHACFSYGLPKSAANQICGKLLDQRKHFSGDISYTLFPFRSINKGLFWSSLGVDYSYLFPPLTLAAIKFLPGYWTVVRDLNFSSCCFHYEPRESVEIW